MNEIKGKRFSRVVVVILLVMCGITVLTLFRVRQEKEERAAVMVVIFSDGNWQLISSPDFSKASGTMEVLPGPAGKSGFRQSLAGGGKIDLTYMADSPVVNTSISVFVYDEVGGKGHFVPAGENLLIERLVEKKKAKSD